MSRPFDLRGPLPVGRLALDASAGTGKTFALAALATRFVAELDYKASDLLVVTFTRAATAELRERIRTRWMTAAAHLLDAGDGARRQDERRDEMVEHLAAAGPAESLARGRRLRRAVVEFDSMTVATIHGFAAQALGALGATGGVGTDAKLIDDVVAASSEVCADVLAAASTGDVATYGELPKYTTLVQRTRTALHSPDLVVAPGPGEAGVSLADRRFVELVEASVAELARRRRCAGNLSFDDLLVELRDALGGPRRDTVLDALRRRYKVVLIDEFQDTDPIQWSVFEAVFADAFSDTPLVLVGDPKQSIYSFRGADVHTYLGAVEALEEGRRVHLATNWRSDQRLLTALETLFGGATFGEGIEFSPVVAPPEHQETAIRAAGTGIELPAVSIRLALDPSLPLTQNKRAFDVGGVERAIYADLAQQIQNLLEGATIPTSGNPGEYRAVRPDDVAVLTKTRNEAAEIQGALLAQGVPAVLARGSSVLESPAADHWRLLLEALVRPSDTRRARAFALSWFGPWDATRLQAATDAELAEIQSQLHRWAEALATSGVADFVGRVWSESGVAPRVLAQPGGERAVTDLQHIGELLQHGVELRHPSPAALIEVLGVDPVAEEEAETDADLAARRVESDARAVQVMTIWVSKGLQFPIVCVPTLWRGARPGARIYLDPNTGRRTFDVLNANSHWPDKASAERRKALVSAESTGEQLRLTYVALTRARHHTIMWWTRVSNNDSSPVSRLLFARRPDGTICPDAWHEPRVKVPEGLQGALETLESVSRRGGGTIAVEAVGPSVARPRWVDPDLASVPTDVAAAELSRLPDRRSHRWSFTAIAAGLDHGLGGTDPTDPTDPSEGDAGASDESLRSLGFVPEGEASQPHDVAGFGALPAGAEFGSLVHAVLEQLDFTEGDVAAVVGKLARSLLGRHPGALKFSEADRLGEAVSEMLDTPLGAAFEGFRLRDLQRRDRLDEMAFDLRLGDGGAAPKLVEVAEVVSAHLPRDDRLRPWAEALARGEGGPELAGHLTGSVDLVFRHHVDGVARHFVVDYKTNRLDGYRHDEMAAAMAWHHYPLQALLYQVALHRYLRWRVPHYDPAVQLGGVAYLFVRGMVGDETPCYGDEVEGVFHWRVPARLVVELSDLLGGLRPRSGTSQLGMELEP
ncbi:MAG: UvrD-helicase domain-containing protein [Microthrixaceae bacterium]|nr:UvrD-helicase domain-containing protein [Microthrixaceae bacterium]